LEELVVGPFHDCYINPPDYQLLLVPVAMVIAWIIPGYLLRAKYKK
jgi:hypothetical protein